MVSICFIYEYFCWANRLYAVQSQFCVIYAALTLPLFGNVAADRYMLKYKDRYATKYKARGKRKSAQNVVQ